MLLDRVAHVRLVRIIWLGCQLNCSVPCNRMPGREQQIASVRVGDKAGKGNWWHAFNLRISPYLETKNFEYGIVDKVYKGPAVCMKECGIGGDQVTMEPYRPSMASMIDRGEMRVKSHL